MNADSNLKESFYLRPEEQMNSEENVSARPVKNADGERKISQIENEEDFFEKLENLKQQFEEGMKENELNNHEDLLVEIEKRQKEIQRLEKLNRPKTAAKEKVQLEPLEQLLEFFDQICQLQRRLSSDDAELKHLQKEFEKGLGEYELRDLNDLLSEIEVKSNQLNGCKDITHKKALELSKTLTKLESLRSISKRISDLKALQEQPGQKIPLSQFSKEELHGNEIKDYNLNTSLFGLSFSTIRQINESIRINESRPQNLVSGKNLVSCSPIRNKKEYIAKLSKEISMTPPCSEKYISTLMLLAIYKQDGEEIFTEAKVIQPKDSEGTFQKEFELLKDRLKVEDLESRVSEDMEAIHRNAKSNDWQAVQADLLHLFRKLKDLDLQELFRLVSKTNDAAEIVKDQDIILFLGGTGTGKSTTIHFLAGSKMEKTEVNGLDHIAVCPINNPALENVTTSPFSCSETRYITSVPVKIKDVGGCKFGTVILCDSPGFEDTSGPEVDIANGIGIIKAVKECKSVKPVILISSKSTGDRLGGLRDLAHLLVSMIPGMTEHLRAFSYIFTKYPPEERPRIHAQLQNLEDNLRHEEPKDLSFIEFFHDMLKKTKDEVIALDPCAGNPGEILDKLVGTHSILHPDEIFRFSITEKSKTAVEKQARRHLDNISSGLKRSDYAYVKYKLDELKQLSDLLELEYITQIYSDCVIATHRHIEEVYHKSTAEFNKCLKNENELRPEDVKLYQECINRAKGADDLKAAHLGKESIHSEAYLLNISCEIDKIFSTIQQMDLTDSFLKLNLDKIQLLCRHFSDFVDKYERVDSILSEKLDPLQKLIKTATESNDFDRFAEEMTKLQQAISRLKDHLLSKNFETTYSMLKTAFICSLKNSVEEQKTLFKSGPLKKKEISSLLEVIKRLESAKSNLGLHFHVSLKQIDLIYKSLIEKILGHFEKINKDINTKFEELRENSFQLLEELIKEMNLMRTIPIVELRTSTSYYSTLEMLYGFITELKREVENMLAAIFQRKEEGNYQKLSSCLIGLQNAKWMEEFRAGIHSDVMKNIKVQILDYVVLMQDFMSKVDLDISNSENLEKANQVSLRIKKIKPLESIFQELGPEIETTGSLFEEKINLTLDSIREFLEKWNQTISNKVQERAITGEEEQKNNEHRRPGEISSPTTLSSSRRSSQLDFERFNLETINRSLIYLLICNQNKLLQKDNNIRLFQDMEDFIKAYQELCQGEMIRCFDFITIFDNGNREELFKASQQLSNHLEEIREIRLKYPEFYRRFDQNIMDEWKRILNKHLQHLQDLLYEMDQMIASKNNRDLNNMLMIAKALSHLDDFLEKSTGKYIEVYREYQNKFFYEASSNMIKITNAIKESDYKTVSTEMANLEDINNPVLTSQLQECKKILNDHINNLLEETQCMARLLLLRDKVALEKVESLVKNLTKIQNATEHLTSSWIDKERLVQCINGVKVKVSEDLKKLIENIEILIKGSYFSEVEAQKTSLNMICHIIVKRKLLYVVKSLTILRKQSLMP